jgi:hypothetical protein
MVLAPQLLRLVSGVDRYRPPPQRAFAPRSDAQRRGKESPTSDLDLARLTRANLFLVGDDDVVIPVVTSLWQSLATPIVIRNRGERLRLSPASQPGGTIVVCDVDTLTGQEQRALYNCMAVNGRTQVVSTASKFLQPLLQAGAFDEGLYYRLNVVTLDLTPPVAP